MVFALVVRHLNTREDANTRLMILLMIFPFKFWKSFLLLLSLPGSNHTTFFREFQDSHDLLHDKKQKTSFPGPSVVSQPNGTPSKENDAMGNSTDPEFEKLSLVWGKQRQPPLNHEEWENFLDSEGRIMDSKALRKRIFYGGVEHKLRKEVWKFLLGLYEYDSTYAEREFYQSVKKTEYETIKSQWKSISEVQAKRFTKFRERRGLIEKDVVRTDRSVPYYEGDDNPNITVLHDILLTYSFYNFDLGYCQGMSDLLSPILFVMRMNQKHSGHLLHLWNAWVLTLIVIKVECTLNFLHCLREFEYADTMYLWEVLWTHYLSEHFHLYICIAILRSHRKKIMQEQMDFDTLLKFINGLSNQIDVDAVVRDAEALCVCAGENGAACIPPGTPPSLPIESDAGLYARHEDEVL
ncbi:hypothetical protein HPP92_010889 [Vanilla planifolia]|uniref:Rab-GAP TBC domain-containing protein n=1 Tax=Vanilla planifolia TaxID=51239 RepID=A0A835QZG8_VANPL|nr:hypothetical protein HPP92_010889 [Vanilla planifolia]